MAATSCVRCSGSCRILSRRFGVVHDQVGTPTWGRALAEALWREVAGPRSQRYRSLDRCRRRQLVRFRGSHPRRGGGSRGSLHLSGEPVIPIGSHEFAAAARRPPYSVLDKDSGWAALGGPARHWRENLRSDAGRISACVICSLPAGPVSSGPPSCTTGLEAHPSDRVVVLDALTYAGNLPVSLDRAYIRPRVLSRATPHTRAGRDPASGPRITTHRPFRGRIPRGPLHRWPRCTRRDQHLGNARAAHRQPVRSGRRRAQKSGARFHHISTDEVYGSLGLRYSSFHRASPPCTCFALCRQQGRVDHLARAYHHTDGLPVTISELHQLWDIPFRRS